MNTWMGKAKFDNDDVENVTVHSGAWLIVKIIAKQTDKDHIN